MSLEAFELNEDVALVTGAASGIGRAYAEAMAEAGADVAIADVDTDGLSETASLVESAGAEVLEQETDVSDEAEVEAMVDATVDTFDGLDVAFANAGIAGVDGVGSQIESLPTETWDDVMDVNLRGVFFTDRYAAAAMDDGGSIVNTASILSFVAAQLPGLSPYVASKGGVRQLTRQLAAELGPRGIRVNAVAPGWIRTNIGGGMLAGASGGFADDMAQETCLKRLGNPEDLKGVATFLASDASEYCTGATLRVDGGWTVF